MSAPEWLTGLLTDPAVTDICLNGEAEAFADRGLGLAPVEGAAWSAEALRAWVLDQLSAAGKTWDARYPFIDATVAPGHRLHVAFPPLSRRGLLVSLRRLPRPADEADPARARAAAERRWGAGGKYELLARATRAGESVLVCGATGSGKTTLANDLLGEVPEGQRVIALEDTPELAPRHPHFITLVSRPANSDGHGEVTLRDLLRQTLRMRPDRVILGECRGAEVLDLLQALNTGHAGAMATIHANSPRDALRRLELLCLLAAPGSLGLGAIRELVANGLRWIAHCSREGAHRQISAVCGVEGREGDTILLRPMLQMD